jgi:Flp pilus assembly protein TadD
MGCLLEDQGRLAEALGFLEEGLVREERQPILTIVGSVQRRLGDIARAESTLQRSVELNPEDDEAHFGLGLTLSNSTPSVAVEHFRRALEIDPALPQARRELGQALWRLGELDKAEEAYRQAIEQNPSDVWAHDSLGLLIAAREDWTNARNEFAIAVELEPGRGFFWANLGDAYLALGNKEEAERCYLRGLAAEIDEPHVNGRYGLFLRKVGRLTSARNYLKRALELAPNQERVRNALMELEKRLSPH